MTVGSDRKVCGMQESRLKSRCSIKTVENESNVYPNHEKKRVELGSVVITVENECKVSATHKNRRRELACTITTV